MNRSLPPVRVLIALGVTLFAVALLGVRALTDGSADRTDGTADPTTSSTPTDPASDGSVPPTSADSSTTSLVILPDWYPKQNSRYSDRQPVVTVTTLATTSTTSTTTTVARSRTQGG